MLGHQQHLLREALRRRADLVLVGDIGTTERLVQLLRANARRGRWTSAVTQSHAGGRPMGSGAFKTTQGALEALGKGYREADDKLAGEREVRIGDLAAELHASRSTVYWWLSRWDLTIADLAIEANRQRAA